MSTVSRHIDASPAQVCDVLTDGWLYTGWVVGAAHIRNVDPDWPAPGSRLHHAVGGWPLMLQDTTRSEQYVPDRLLQMRARAWPLGEAVVRVELDADATGTLVTMREEPVKGPARWWHNPVQDWTFDLRNREALDRLAAIVVGRVSHRQ